VETRPSYFFEGAWAGSFRQGGFADALVSFGSGGASYDDGWLFATPTHTLDRLYLLEADREILISNSLPLVLACANEELDPHYPHHVRDWLTLMREGLDRRELRFRTRRGRTVRLIHHTNIRIAADRSIGLEPKRLAPPFESFDQYRTYLEDAVVALHDNATDAARRRKYEPVTAVSSGYDSPAAAVLARHVGCRRALTLSEARKDNAWEDGSDDSGAPIAVELLEHLIDQAGNRIAQQIRRRATENAPARRRQANRQADLDATTGVELHRGSLENLLTERRHLDLPALAAARAAPRLGGSGA